jgi:hypothetical protein
MIDENLRRYIYLYLWASVLILECEKGLASQFIVYSKAQNFSHKRKQKARKMSRPE